MYFLNHKKLRKIQTNLRIHVLALPTIPYSRETSTIKAKDKSWITFAEMDHKIYTERPWKVLKILDRPNTKSELTNILN
jgi:hypothetical protein